MSALNLFLEEETDSEDIESEGSSTNDITNIEKDPKMDIDLKEMDISENTNNNQIMINSNIVLTVEELFAKELEKQKNSRSHFPSSNVDHVHSLSFDLGYLSCYDPQPIDIQLLFQNQRYKKLKNGNEENTKNRNVKHCMSQLEYESRKLDENYLFNLTRNNMQAMLNRLYSLPTIKTAIDDPSIVVKLPPMKAKLPREKPMPIAKPMTRWETFAARKGIRTSKKTKDLLQFDELSQTWKKKYGYNRANDALNEPVFEHKSNDMSTDDPWTKLKKERKVRREQNRRSQLMNLQSAYGDRISGTIDLQSALNFKKRNPGKRFLKQQSKNSVRKYGHLNAALNIAQHSTASMGKFDVLNKNEPKPKLKANAKKSVEYLQRNRNTKLFQMKFGKKAFGKKEREKQHEIMFQIFGKKQENAFNVQKAAHSAKISIERLRHKKRMMIARNKANNKKSKNIKFKTNSRV